MGDDDDRPVGQHPAQHLAQRPGRQPRRGRPWARRGAAAAGRRPARGRRRCVAPDRRRAAPGRGRRTAPASTSASHRRAARGTPLGERPTLRGPKATLSSAVRCGNSRGSWASSATPRSCAGTHTVRRRARPDVEQHPAVQPDVTPTSGRSSPAITRQHGGLAGAVRARGAPRSRRRRRRRRGRLRARRRWRVTSKAIRRPVRPRANPMTRTATTTSTSESATAASASVSRCR